MEFLGIDLGTTFIKGAVLNLKERRLEHIRRLPFPNRLRKESPLQWEFDPNEVVAAAQSLINELAAHAPSCEGIVMCSQMHGLVLVNDHGEAISNCTSWRDERALMPHPSGHGTYFGAIARRVGAQQQRQLGHELEPGRPICVLFWLAERGELDSGLTPVSMPDFVLSRLCNSAPGVEATNASAYGAFNLETLDWHYDVIRELGLAHLNWPAIRRQGEIVGSMKVGGRGVPCYMPVGDYQCALVGALFGADELSLNISTGSQVSRLTATLSLGDYQTRPFFEGEFLNTFTYTPGGRALNILVNLLAMLPASRDISPEDCWKFISEAVSGVGETDLKVDLTFFPAPDGARGSITNIRADNLTAGHLFRAAFNDMAEKYSACALRLWPEKSWKNIVFSGGLACKLEVLRNIIQKKLGTRYRLPPSTEDTLYGLLALALAFSGNASSIKKAQEGLRSDFQDSEG